jgi:hypothetical protein
MQSLGRTWYRRRDVIDDATLSRQDRTLLDEYVAGQGQGNIVDRTSHEPASGRGRTS